MSEVIERVVGEISNPFQKRQAGHINAGTVAIESERAIAEAQGKLVIAKRFPRDEAAAFSRVMDSCKRPNLAAVANYRYPRGGQTVSGPSIRLAEELARCWGNIDYGIRELSRRDGESEMEAYAWDLETNTVSSQKFAVRHIRDKKGGGEALRDERDIYEVTANMGARRLRARLIAILPPDLVDAAVEECRKTASGNNTLPIADQIKEMVKAFSRFGVNADMISSKLGHSIDDTTIDELTELRETFTSIKDGIAKASDFFGSRQAEGQPKISKLDQIEQQIVQDEPKAGEVSKKISALGLILSEIESLTQKQVESYKRNAAFAAKLNKLSAEDQKEFEAYVSTLPEA